MILNTCYPRVDKTLSSANNDRDHIIIIILAIIFVIITNIIIANFINITIIRLSRIGSGQVC